MLLWYRWAAAGRGGGQVAGPVEASAAAGVRYAAQVAAGTALGLGLLVHYEHGARFPGSGARLLEPGLRRLCW